MNDQLSINFTDTVKVRRIESERNRDSEGKFATDLVAANDMIERVCNERDIYRTNYLTVAKELSELKRELKK
jgi:hypothetical protein